MKYDCDKVIRVSLAIEHHDEEMEERVKEVSGWTRGEKAAIPWCVGVHVSAALERLFTNPAELKEAIEAIVDCHRETVYSRKAD